MTDNDGDKSCETCWEHPKHCTGPITTSEPHRDDCIPSDLKNWHSKDPCPICDCPSSDHTTSSQLICNKHGLCSHIGPLDKMMTSDQIKDWINRLEDDDDRDSFNYNCTVVSILEQVLAGPDKEPETKPDEITRATIFCPGCGTKHNSLDDANKTFHHYCVHCQIRCKIIVEDFPQQKELDKDSLQSIFSVMAAWKEDSMDPIEATKRILRIVEG